VQGSRAVERILVLGGPQLRPGVTSGPFARLIATIVPLVRGNEPRVGPIGSDERRSTGTHVCRVNRIPHCSACVVQSELVSLDC
jgi:hypothetical protein